MRAVIQRVRSASVTVDGAVVSRIGRGGLLSPSTPRPGACSACASVYVPPVRSMGASGDVFSTQHGICLPLPSVSQNAQRVHVPAFASEWRWPLVSRQDVVSTSVLQYFLLQGR